LFKLLEKYFICLITLSTIAINTSNFSVYHLGGGLSPYRKFWKAQPSGISSIKNNPRREATENVVLLEFSGAVG